MSNTFQDCSDGNTKQVKMLPLNDPALSTLLRSNIIARIKDQMIHAKAICQGWLMMNNGRNGNWVNRWVELRDTCLFYYKDSQSVDYINVIDVDGYNIRDFTGKPCSFQATKPGEKSYYFCTHTTEEMKRWKKALRKAISSSEQQTVSLPRPGPISFYISEKQLHIDIPMGDLYWWMEMLCDSKEEKKTVMKSFYRNDTGSVKSAVAIAFSINGKTLIGHLECINNAIILKFDSLQPSSLPIQYLFLENGKLQAAVDDKETSNTDQKQSKRNAASEIQTSTTENVTRLQSTIDDLQSQLQSEKKSATEMSISAEIKEKQLQEAVDKHTSSIKILQQLLQSEKESSLKVKSLANEKQKELQLALEKGVKENDDLEKMVQQEKDNAARAQAVVDQKEKELQSALQELNVLKSKLQMQSQPEQSTEDSATRIIKPGKVHNLVALFSRSESTESKEELTLKRRPLQAQFSLPERNYRN